MHRTFETNIHLSYQYRAFFITIYRFMRLGHQSVQRQSSDITYELRDENQTEANIVVAVVRIVPVAVRTTTVPGVVVPAASTQNTVRTLN